MRMYQHRNVWYVEFPGGKRRSLRTKDKREAKGIFRDLKIELARGNLIKLEKTTTPTISRLKKLYTKNPDRTDLSDESIRGDGIALQKLIDVVDDISIGRISKNHITKFKQACRSQNNKPISINTYLTRIRAALNWAHENEYLPEPPPKIVFLKTGEQLPRVITPDDLKRIIGQAQKTKPEMYRIIQFALYTGTRRIEVNAARYEHIKNGSILIHGKGKKERLIPLIDQARAVLLDQNFGKIFSYRHVSTISNYYRMITRAAGVKSRFHDLRHTAGTQMLTMGVPLEVVQKILGHSDLRTTQIYSKVVQNRLKNEMEKLKYD